MEDREMRKITAVTAGSIFLAILVIAGFPQLGDAGVIYGCVGKMGGLLRIVGGAGKCTRYETEISWNQVGPTGPEGPEGPQGPEGPAGTGGGISGISAVASAVINADGSIWVASPGVSASKGDPGFYGITLPQDFQTVWPVVPVCTATSLFDLVSYLETFAPQSTCYYDPEWACLTPGVNCTLYTNVKCFKGSTNVDSVFSIICVK
jgi:hypothetical protein